MTKWSLAYQILRAFVRFIFKRFYKKVASIGHENIPIHKPILFAANHQNALIDPLAIIFTNPNQSVFLTRADVFNNPILQKIFTFLKMLPVYRIRDGADSLKNNERIFNQSVEILEASMSVALFPEAAHTDKRHLMPLKKAVPRIAFMSEEKNDFKLDLHIVPVGIYYENYEQSNSTLFVNYGKPLLLKKYEELYKSNNQKGFQALKEDLENAIIPLIIHVKDMEHYPFYESIRLFFRERMRQALQLKNDSPKNNFIADQQTIEKLDQHFQNTNEHIETLEQAFNALETKAKKLGIDLFRHKSLNLFRLILLLLVFLTGLPVFIYALINNYLYYALSMKFIHKIKDHQFYSSFKFGLTLVLGPIMYLIHTLIFYFITGNLTWTFLYLISLPTTAYIANKYRYGWKTYWKDITEFSQSIGNKAEYQIFKGEKSAFMEKLAQKLL